REVKVKTIALGVVFFLISSGLLLAQSESGGAQGGTLAGTVMDQTGKTIPDAGIDVRSESSGASRTATTGVDGRFSIQNLPAGSYSVVVSAPGFARATRSSGQVNAGGTLDVPI